MLKLRGVSKSYDGGRSFAVRDVDLVVNAGELLVLLGTSGCGKTTTLKMINRLIEPTRGEIEVDGLDIQKQDPIRLRRSIGYVFQGIGLFPHMTIGENVAIVPSLLKWNAADCEARVRELLMMVNLPPGEFQDRMPASLSGGQQQRVGLARALAARPRIMLMDEPFGALDPLTRDALQEEFLRIHRELELTTVLVTHDMTEALLLADRIAVMRDGGVVQLGTPHELMTAPADEFVQQMMVSPKRKADQLESLLADAGRPS